jgi:hypothetical protein
MGGTGKHPCKLRKTAENYVKMLKEQHGRQAKFTVVETT